MSKLYFRYGAMNCGKTTLLMQVAHNYEERGMNVAIIKPAIDTKGNEKIVSRIGLERKVDFLIKKKENIEKLLEKIAIKKMQCILVDEAQFLEKKQIESLFIFTKKYNIPVICYGLKNDFKTKMFEGSKRLFELADSIEELNTICRCGKKAKFNARKVHSEFVNKGNQVEVDNQCKIEYESLCGKCYIEKVLKKIIC